MFLFLIMLYDFIKCKDNMIKFNSKWFEVWAQWKIPNGHRRIKQSRNLYTNVYSLEISILSDSWKLIPEI